MMGLIMRRKFDSPTYTLQIFVPSSTRNLYLSIRALNIELARIPDLVSNPSIGNLRMQFWRDNINQTFDGIPRKEPVSTLLSHALTSLRSQNPGIKTAMMKAWLLKIINTREQYMDNKPYINMTALENYAENTYSNLLYITLAALPTHSTTADHIASHIGKANGITAVLKGLPLIAFPAPQNHHSNYAISGAGMGKMPDRRREAVVLPLDVMAEAGVKEEDIFRHGSAASGLKDAVFTVATRANDHLITAREMLKQVLLDNNSSYDHEAAHLPGESNTKFKSQIHEIMRSFGVFMPAVSTRIWLEKLEKLDFDIFRPELRARDWLLPWKTYWAYTKKSI